MLSCPRLAERPHCMPVWWGQASSGASTVMAVLTARCARLPGIMLGGVTRSCSAKKVPPAVLELQLCLGVGRKDSQQGRDADLRKLEGERVPCSLQPHSLFHRGHVLQFQVLWTHVQGPNTRVVWAGCRLGVPAHPGLWMGTSPPRGVRLLARGLQLLGSTEHLWVP